jgi:hypothetical protein
MHVMRASYGSAQPSRSINLGEEGLEDCAMIQLDPKTIIDVVPFDARRRPREYALWHVVRVEDGDPWHLGDRFKLYRVADTSVFRLEHDPIAVNRLRARFRETMMPLWLLIAAVVYGDMEQVGGNLELARLPSPSDDGEQYAGAAR